MKIKHIAFIMDGNRRFAKRLHKHPWMAYEWGTKKVEQVLKWCIEFEVKYVTIYAFSLQNFGRPKKEFDFLMKMFRKNFMAITDPKHSVHKYRVSIKTIGRTQMLPKSVRRAITLAEQSKKNYGKYFLNIAIAYGGQEEIRDAALKIAKKISKGSLKADEINEKTIGQNLYADSFPPPDIVIRTGGEKRLSNFLLWQSPYSELFFIEKTWPEFEREDFVSIVKEFQKQRRTFGR